MKDIVASFDPTITIRGLKVPLDDAPDGQKNERRSGSYYPMIDINGLQFARQHIVSFNLFIGEDFLPTINCSLREVGQNFINKFFPLDGEVISVLIRSLNKDLKPIRQDYRILSVEPSIGNDGQNTYSISAVLDVPQLFVDKIKDFPSMSSIDTLKAIAKELGLGFATNVTSVDDIMTRICPNTDYLDFINNDVLSGAYANDDSFFACYIDQHYYLNFVEVNELIKTETDPELTTITDVTVDHVGADQEKDPVVKRFLLTNNAQENFTANKIDGYSLKSISGEVSLYIGYRAFLHYYDKKNESSKDVFIETLTDPSATTDTVLLKGRDDEDHTKQIRSIHFGNLHTDNVHKNYYVAKVQNIMNEMDLKKINLTVRLPDFNPNLTMFKIVPVLIANYDRSYSDENSPPGKPSINFLASGTFIVTSLVYNYDPALMTIHTTSVLAKREYIKADRENKNINR